MTVSTFPRILFPTDFSAAANQHLPYVTYILSHIKPKELCVLNVQRSRDTSPVSTPVERKSIDQMDFDTRSVSSATTNGTPTTQTSSSELNSRKDDYLTKLETYADDANIEFKQRQGRFVEVVKAEANNYQLLIMGTHGRGYVQGKLLGSNCSKVVSSDSIKCPILVIPTHKISNLHIHKMVYATQLRHGKVDVANLKRFLEFASYFNAKVVFLHVDKHYATHANESEKQGYMLKQRQQEMEEKLKAQIDQHCPERLRRKYAVIFNKSIAPALTTYTREKDVDLLALIKVKRSFMSKLFHNSVCKNMSLFGQVPLMVFNSG